MGGGIDPQRSHRVKIETSDGKVSEKELCTKIFDEPRYQNTNMMPKCISKLIGTILYMTRYVHYHHHIKKVNKIFARFNDDHTSCEVNFYF